MCLTYDSVATPVRHCTLNTWYKYMCETTLFTSVSLFAFSNMASCCPEDVILTNTCKRIDQQHLILDEIYIYNTIELIQFFLLQ